ncbi:hypothetical protein NLM33_40065 [Bradyrhizobium sp. CCGUVB1N3]|uniref:hypothetical protein n=1 Tax=Bradyrhizobium sp. CCGUVB1N3 TaxID=2949629 RepID=UPI0020B3B8A5|nr:hypothetical protein [Bradyrhizobium sp. CCGUVB1N3]MCP3476419.1 hypothetical protein [Bradyrhizobium sp. CCGUVB1N3]
MRARRYILTSAALALAIALTAPIDVGSPARAQPAALTAEQSKALETYDRALNEFKTILNQRRRQIDAHEPLPDRPGQALYLARVDVMSSYKDLTDALPSRIGRPNKYEVPPTYFDADIEPLIDEYRALFDVMEAPPANAQASPTPFKDVVDLGTAIARAKGLDAKGADAAGRISLGLFFAETNGKQNVGNGRAKAYIGSFQTGPSEDRNGRKQWQSIKASIAAFDPQMIARDDKEEARAAGLDHRLNHWTAVRDGLMNAHADLFAQIPGIARTLPDPIDQMKFFELIQIIPTATRAALKSGNLLQSRVSDPTVMKYLRNNSIFAYGRADRARTSASFREILDAMWLFNQKFARAQAEFERVRTR